MPKDNNTQLSRGLNYIILRVPFYGKLELNEENLCNNLSDVLDNLHLILAFSNFRQGSIGQGQGAQNEEEFGLTCQHRPWFRSRR